MLVRKFLPELDDNQFQQLVSNILNTSLLEELETTSRPEPIVLLPTPASMTLGSVSESFMFHALFMNLMAHEDEHMCQIVQKILPMLTQNTSMVSLNSLWVLSGGDCSISIYAHW